MTTTMEEVAGWLRAESDYVYNRWVDLIGYDAAKRKAKVCLDRAAQVEAMEIPKTCDTCDHWDNSPWKLAPERRLCLCQEEDNDTESWGFVDDCGPKFGCIHHEDKQQINDLGGK